jgi:L-ascorbate metabolism protein UlaG (beta-lactamase superfamily)
MKLSYHGHSVVKIETNGIVILIDPFISGNPLTDLDASVVKPDVIIVTHGHGDHLGDTIELAKKHDSLVISNFELATYLSWQGVKNTHGMSIGGAYQFDFGRVKLTQAIHGTGLMTENQEIIYLGMPAGVLLTIEGKTIYHAGDTGLFSDMKLIGREQIDVAFLPIGDNFTMGPEDAALAAEFLQARKVVPIHYNTFPPIVQDPNDFVAMLKDDQGLVLKPGEGIDL